MAETDSIQPWTPSLQPWTPPPVWEEDDAGAPRERIPVRRNALDLIVSLEAGVQACDLTALDRAVTRPESTVRLFKADARLDGEPWYDALGRLTRMWIEYDNGMENYTLTCPRTRIGDIDNGLPDRIKVHYEVLWPGKQKTIGTLRTDFAIANEWTRSAADAGILVTPDSRLTVDEMCALLRHAAFVPREKSHSKCDETVASQKAEFDDVAHRAACELLMNQEQALEASLQYAVREHLARLFPKDRRVRIEHDPANADTTISIGKPPRRNRTVDQTAQP